MFHYGRLRSLGFFTALTLAAATGVERRAVADRPLPARGVEAASGPSVVGQTPPAGVQRGLYSPGIIRRLPPIHGPSPSETLNRSTESGDGSSTPYRPPNHPESRRAVTAIVHGRLANGQIPLVRCRVVLIPFDTTAVRGDFQEAELLTSVTDENGMFTFPEVPQGKYKMKWLPAGTRQWIRRISLKPDVQVRTDKEIWLKEIRVATRTVN